MSLDTAGPSSAPVISFEQLQKAQLDYQKGLHCLQAGELSDAVELLGLVLETRLAKYGDFAPECASTYFHYGMALFQKAQQEFDVLGARLQSAASKHESRLTNGNTTTSEAADALADASRDRTPDPESAVDQDGEDQSTSEVQEKEGESDSEYEDNDKENGEDQEDAQSSDSDDMQLAWQMLELAKLIYNRQPTPPKSELADVHMLLADVSMEQEVLDRAIEDYMTALELLAGTEHEVDGLCASEDGVLPTQGGSRRMAELHYKLALARQFMDEPEAALGSVKAAIGILEKIVAGLRPQPAEPPSFSFGLPDSPDAAAADASADAPEDPQVKAQVEDLHSVLDDLWEKVDELKEAARSKASTKATLKAAFSQLASAGNGAGHQAANGAPAALPPVSTDAALQDPHTAGGSASAEVPAAAASAGAGPSGGAASGVQDLGVVGRGKRRITLQPQRLPEAGKKARHEDEAAAVEPIGSVSQSIGSSVPGQTAHTTNGSVKPFENGSHA